MRIPTARVDDACSEKDPWPYGLWTTFLGGVKMPLKV